MRGEGVEGGLDLPIPTIPPGMKIPSGSPDNAPVRIDSMELGAIVLWKLIGPSDCVRAYD